MPETVKPFKRDIAEKGYEYIDKFYLNIELLSDLECHILTEFLRLKYPVSTRSLDMHSVLGDIMERRDYLDSL